MDGVRLLHAYPPEEFMKKILQLLLVIGIACAPIGAIAQTDSSEPA
jgi:hypothetical protein